MPEVSLIIISIEYMSSYNILENFLKKWKTGAQSKYIYKEEKKEKEEKKAKVIF